MTSTLSAISHLGRNLTQCQISRFSAATSRLLDGSRWNCHHQFATPSLTPKRHLFNDAVLGVDRFSDIKRRVTARFGSNKNLFIERLEEFLASSESLILPEDLKNLIFLCENAKDAELLKRAIQSFETQNGSLKFGTFQFGPLVMRMAHLLNMPDLAISLMDKQNVNFYSQLSSVVAALDLLFENGRYEEVVKLFNFVVENYKFDTKYPADFTTIFLAACYKLNTIDAYDQAFRLLRQNPDFTAVRYRGIAFFFALALNQKQPNVLIELFPKLKFTYCPPTIMSLRLLAFANIGHFRDIFDILRYQLKRTDRAVNRRKVVFESTLKEIGQILSKSNQTELTADYENIVKSLTETGVVYQDRTLEEALVEPIVPVIKNAGQNQQQPRSSQAQERQQSASA